MKMPDDIQNKQVYKLGIFYIAVITIIAAVSNYFTWHAKFTSDILGIGVFFLGIMLWISFYVPMYIFIKRASWRVEDFGFVINKRLTIISAILIIFISFKINSSFSFAFIGFFLLEAFARVGEELFYRGFIYNLVLKLSKAKQNSWLFAVFISSFLFTIMHTQTFLPDNPLNMPSIFISALLLGLLRHWTGSILPGIIIHCAANGGILSMIMGILIYILIFMIDYFKERAKRVKSRV